MIMELSVLNQNMIKVRHFHEKYISLTANDVIPSSNNGK